MDGRGFEVAPGIHRIEATVGERVVACHLVVGDDDVLLVDTGIDGTPASTIAPYLATLGMAPERIGWVVLTHGDVEHIGGAASLRERSPAARFVAHAEDVELVEDVDRIIAERYSELAEDHGIDADPARAAWCREAGRPVPVDLIVDGGEILRLGADRFVELVHTPGHSWGSLSIWVPWARAAIVGDAVLGAGFPDVEGRPLVPPGYRHVTPYLATIADLESLRPELLLTGHVPVLRHGEVAAFLMLSRTFTQAVEAAVIARLRAATRPLTTRALVERVAPELGSWPAGEWSHLAGGIVGHLEELAEAGRVRGTRRRDRTVAWSYVGPSEPATV
jgi:glyoxylase-like metal-dependent hydrolase (beta-lactamase superfamily II)